MIIPAEININDYNTCQYAIWHELKICALIEKTGISRDSREIGLKL